MANSIESRTPFVDHKLIEYLFSIKTKYFLKENTTKYMLKKYWVNYIDKSCIYKNIKDQLSTT